MNINFSFDLYRKKQGNYLIKFSEGKEKGQENRDQLTEFSDEQIKDFFQKHRNMTIGELIGVPHPKTMEEFEHRLEMFLDDWKKQFFGLTYETKKPLKNVESLVNGLLVYEKCTQKNKFVSSLKVDLYQFLKLVLEKDASLLGLDEYILGIKRDRLGCSLPQKNIILVQCAAQVLWYIEKEKIPTIEAMIQSLLYTEHPFSKDLRLHRFNSQRTIEDWVRPIFPLPREERKKQQNKDIKVFDHIIKIPNIFTEQGINFPRLRFALRSITKILKSLGWTIDQVLESKFVINLVDSFKFYPRLYVKDWIEEVFEQR